MITRVINEIIMFSDIAVEVVDLQHDCCFVKITSDGNDKAVTYKLGLKESVEFADDIHIGLWQIDGNKGRFACRAPRGIPIHRKELYDAIRNPDILPFDRSSAGS